MSVEATYDLKLSVQDTKTLSLDSGTDPAIARSTDVSGKLTGATSTPATKHALITGTLTTGAATLNLTSLTDGVFTEDFTGLKVQLCKITNASTNSATLTVADGATTGYQLFGDASGQVTIPVGGTVQFYFPEGLANVSASLKNIDLSSSDQDATYTFQAVAG